MADFVPDELLVQFKPGVRESRRAAGRSAQRAAVLRRFRALDIEHLRLPKGVDPRVVARALRANPDVRDAQPNYIYHVTASAPPNDQYWLDGSLWGLERISVQPAWTTFGSGGTTVVVAVIDTGVDYNHPDLAANMWRNPGEIPGNRIDDDGNGYIDDVHGVDMVDLDQDPADPHGHGTHTSGTVGAVANNHIGVVGVSSNVRIMACRAMSDAGLGTDAKAAECFNYVVDQKNRGVNVRVTSNSWGRRRSGGMSAVLKNAIDAAGNAGILNVFSAGNSGTNNDVEPFDPASFTSPSVVAVAASDRSDNRPAFSNYGSASVHLAAPGVNILSTGGPYTYWSGTSMAAPHVAGAAAVLFSHYPTLSVSEVKDALLNNVDELPQWNGLVTSRGRLNVFHSLVGLNTNASPTVALTSPADGATFIAPATIPLAATANDSDGTVVSVDFYANGNLIGSDTSAPFELAWTGVGVGTYNLTAVATDNARATTQSAPVGTVVEAATGSTPFPGTPIGVPGTIESEHFDHGGAGIAYHDLSLGNDGGEFRATDVDIAVAADTGNGYTLGWVGAGEWLNYTVSVGVTGSYDLDARVASNGAGGTFHIEVNGIDVTGPLTIPNTGNWQSWTTVRRPAVSLSAGQQVWRLVMDSNGATGAVGNINYIAVTPSSGGGGSTPFYGTPVALPGTLQAEDFDNGGQGIAYHDQSPGNEGGEYRVADVDIAATTDTGSGYTLGWVGAGEWLTYTVNVGMAGSYDVDVRVASSGAGGTFHIEVNGVDVTGSLTVPNTDGWQSWTTIRRRGIGLSAGQQVWRLVMDTNGVTGAVGNINYITVTPSSDNGGSTPYYGTPLALPGTVQAEDFDSGGRGIAYHDLSPGNEGGEYRVTDVDIAAAADTGGYTLGWVGAGEWLTFTVNVGAAGSYDLDVRVASAGTGGMFHIEVNGIDVTGPLTVPNTDGWQSWTTIRRSSVSLSAGQQVWRLVMDTNGATGAVGNFNDISVVASSAGGSDDQ